MGTICPSHSVEESSLVYIRMDIQTLVVGMGPVPSLLVLKTKTLHGDTPIQLPIRIGSVEAAAISMGIEDTPHDRPLTHDLLRTVINTLGAKLTGVAIVDVVDTTFYAQLMLTLPDGSSRQIDCRPSDGIALAVREGVPIMASESVLETATLPDFMGVERDEQDRELERFHSFVESITPDDFIDSI